MRVLCCEVDEVGYRGKWRVIERIVHTGWSVPHSLARIEVEFSQRELFSQGGVFHIVWFTYEASDCRVGFHRQVESNRERMWWQNCPHRVECSI